MSDRSVRVRYQIIGVSDRRVIDSSAAVCSGCRTYHASQQYGYSCVSALQYQAWRTVRYWTIPSNFGISVMCSVGYGYCIDIGIEFDTIPINKKKESIRFRYLIHRSFPQSVSAWKTRGCRGMEGETYDISKLWIRYSYIETLNTIYWNFRYDIQHSVSYTHLTLPTTA